jgi:hypothetical protein
MHVYQLLHQSQPDPGALIAPALRALHSVETLEEVWKLALRDASAPIPHPQDRLAFFFSKGHLNFPLEGELEGIGEEIEDYLLPFLPVHVDRP